MGWSAPVVVQRRGHVLSSTVPREGDAWRCYGGGPNGVRLYVVMFPHPLGMRFCYPGEILVVGFLCLQFQLVVVEPFVAAEMDCPQALLGFESVLAAWMFGKSSNCRVLSCLVWCLSWAISLPSAAAVCLVLA
ncbi:hypothetical protein U1Q18_028795 [Sarracenia purpurea var. burkii]